MRIANDSVIEMNDEVVILTVGRGFQLPVTRNGAGAALTTENCQRNALSQLQKAEEFR
jgi:hypothetical protein